MIFGNKILNNFCNFPLVQLAATATVAAAVAGAAAAAAAIVVLKEQVNSSDEKKSENSKSIKSYIVFNMTKSLKKLRLEMWFDSENE
jgi:hypothetical protein